MKTISFKNLVLPVAATALTVVTLANAAITPAFPTISNTFATAGEIIKSADINKLAEGINNLDQRTWVEGTDLMSAPNNSDFVVTDDGKVGIGTTTPTLFPLHLTRSSTDYNGTIIESGTATFEIGNYGESYAASTLHDNGPGSSFMRSSGHLSIVSGADEKITFGAHGASNTDIKMTIENSNGNVGIGTTTPSAKLHVNGDLLYGDAIAPIGSQGNTSVGGYLSSGWSWFAGDNTQSPMYIQRLAPGVGNIVRFYQGNTFVGYISTDGSSVSYNTTSDERKKENIVPLENALENIDKIRGVSFDWKNTGLSSTGVIAQEVEAIYPDFVSTDEDGYKAVDYGKLTAPLIEAVKELKAENDALKQLVCLDHADAEICQ